MTYNLIQYDMYVVLVVARESQYEDLIPSLGRELEKMTSVIFSKIPHGLKFSPMAYEEWNIKQAKNCPTLAFLIGLSQ